MKVLITAKKLSYHSCTPPSIRHSITQKLLLLSHVQSSSWVYLIRTLNILISCPFGPGYMFSVNIYASGDLLIRRKSELGHLVWSPYYLHCFQTPALNCLPLVLYHHFCSIEILCTVLARGMTIITNFEQVSYFIFHYFFPVESHMICTSNISHFLIVCGNTFLISRLILHVYPPNSHINAWISVSFVLPLFYYTCGRFFNHRERKTQN